MIRLGVCRARPGMQGGWNKKLGLSEGAAEEQVYGKVDVNFR